MEYYDAAESQWDSLRLVQTHRPISGLCISYYYKREPIVIASLYEPRHRPCSSFWSLHLHRNRSLYIRHISDILKASTRTQALDDPIEKEFVPKKMMTSNRPRDTLSLPSSSSKASSSSATGSVTAGDSLHLLYKELSSVVDREPAQPGSAEGETNDGSILCGLCNFFLLLLFFLQRHRSLVRCTKTVG